MNLFQMKSKQHGIERMPIFLKDNFVCIGWPGIGNLENLNLLELEQRLAQAYNVADRELAGPLREISCFVHSMQDGDFVLIVEEDAVYLGDVGDYYYIEQYDTPEEGMCHRRGVTWLNRIPLTELNAEVQELLQHSGQLAQFMQAVETTGLERWVPRNSGMTDTPTVKPTVQTGSVDPETIERALAVLTEALYSDDAERRERAASAILQYAKPTNNGI